VDITDQGNQINADVEGKPGVTAEENIRDGREPGANPVVATLRRSAF